jgi:hypothetical protein
MGRIRRLLGALRCYFPLTAAGVGYLVVALFATWWIGVGSSDLVLLIGGGCVLVLLFAFLLAVLLGGLLLRRQLRQLPTDSTPLVLECGRPQPTGWQISWPGWLPFLKVQSRWMTQPIQPVQPGKPGQPDPQLEVDLVSRGGVLEEQVIPRGRGLFEGVTRRLTVSDGLGFAALSFTVTEPRPVEIQPAAGSLGSRVVLQNLVAGEDLSNPLGAPVGDRVDMRQYVLGDAPKTILWKVFARSRKLMVKVPEHAVAARPRYCAYLVAMPEDEPAAGLARDVLEGEMLGEGWRFGADGTPGFCSTKFEALRLLSRSGNYEVRQQPSGLGAFLHEAAAAGYRACFVFLGTDPQLGRRQEIAQAAAVHGLEIILCLVAESVIGGASHRTGLLKALRLPARGIDWLLTPQQAQGVEGRRLEQLWEGWQGVGSELRFALRSSGQLYRDIPSLMRAWQAQADAKGRAPGQGQTQSQGQTQTRGQTQSRGQAHRQGQGRER